MALSPDAAFSSPALLRSGFLCVPLAVLEHGLLSLKS
ncbi:Phkb [Phodopus roborovskii]|uniref:Phkb protein n=1 Tax=Phodopus roborovskii TaxID=109678 RepID=A0AAU9ZQQ4_PHORO|nr:Phkb [Phodopus roborovskii]